MQLRIQLIKVLILLGITVIRQSKSQNVQNGNEIVLPECGDVVFKQFSIERIDKEDFDETKTHEFSLPLFGKSRSSCTSSNIRLGKQNLQCQGESFKFPIDLQEVCQTLPKDLKFTTDGQLILDRQTFEKREYCISSHTQGSLDLLICNQTCSETRPCVERCCRNGYSWDITGPKWKCAPSGERSWSPKFYDNYWSSSQSDGGLDPIFLYSHPSRNPLCKGNITWLTLARGINIAFRKAFRVLNDGSVWVKCGQRKYNRLKEGSYCIEGIGNKPGQTSPGYSGRKEDVLLVDCVEDACAENNEEDEHGGGLDLESLATTILYGVTLIICSIFFFATAAVYLLLHEKQTIHGWTTFGYLIAMGLNFLFLACNKFKVYFLVAQTSESSFLNPCSVVGIVGHFAVLSGFSWMCIVNWDIWFTFKSLRMMGKSLRRLRIYITLGLAFPACIVFVGVLMDALFSDDVFNNMIVPEYGKHCFVEYDHAILPYFYAPVGFILSLNVMFYLNTVYSLQKTKKSTQMATQSSTKQNKQINESIKLFGKLVFVMGLPWTVEVISWAAVGHWKTFPWYIVVLDIVTIGQSILVFFIFVVKREIINSLEEKFPKLKGFMNTVRSKTSISCFDRLKRYEQPSTSGHPVSNQTGSTNISNGGAGNDVSPKNGLKNGEIEIKMTERQTILTKE